MTLLQSDRDEVLKWLEEYRREKRSDIDLFKRVKYAQSYIGHEKGKEPMYPPKDEEEEASGDEVESDDYEKDEDTETKEEEEKVQSAGAEGLSSEMAQTEEISEVPSGVPPVHTSVVAATIERAKTESESRLGHVLDSHIESSQVHIVNKKVRLKTFIQVLLFFCYQ